MDNANVKNRGLLIGFIGFIILCVIMYILLFPIRDWQNELHNTRIEDQKRINIINNYNNKYKLAISSNVGVGDVLIDSNFIIYGIYTPKKYDYLSAVKYCYEIRIKYFTNSNSQILIKTNNTGNKTNSIVSFDNLCISTDKRHLYFRNNISPYGNSASIYLFDMESRIIKCVFRLILPPIPATSCHPDLLVACTSGC